MSGEVNLITAILNQWVREAGPDCLSLKQARENPDNYWFIEAISQVTRLEPEQVIDGLIARAHKKLAKSAAKPRPAIVPLKELERRMKQRESLKKRLAVRREEQATDRGVAITG